MSRIRTEFRQVRILMASPNRVLDMQFCHITIVVIGNGIKKITISQSSKISQATTCAMMGVKGVLESAVEVKSAEKPVWFPVAPSHLKSESHLNQSNPRKAVLPCVAF